MLRKATVKRDLIFPVLAFFLFGGSFCQAQERKYFCNEELQSIIKEPFILSDQDKKHTYPLDIENFSAQRSALVKDSAYYAEIENPYFCQETINHLSLCEITRTIDSFPRNKKIGKLYLQQDKLYDYLNEISKEINREPINGKIEIDKTGRIRVIALSQTGQELDIEASCAQIKTILIENPYEKNIPLQIKTVEPEISSDEITDMGIVEKIGQGESNFAGSPKSRIHNIKAAVDRFHGLILDRGEEFSFVKYLGEVDAEHGYLPELVIKNNETIPEFGGGICQVSTTIFRAALNTGLKITARKNHAYPVQYYYPQGTDATIYIPNPDLRFINNTPAKLLIQAKIEGTKLYFYFYGTDDGRKVEIDGPYVTEKNDKNQMKTILYQKVYSSDGNELINDSFQSFYDDPAKYHHETVADNVLTKKPKDWSDNEWKKYKKDHGL
jgi:vancomycin resistance protein YoaR